MQYFKILGVIVLVVVGIVAVRLILSSNSNQKVAGQSDSRIELDDPIAREDINREFTFPIKTASGDEVSKIKYTVLDAEIRNQLIIQGVKKTTKVGRAFLVISLKVENSYEKAIDVQTRNYIRLSVNGNENEWLAPDIHNDPVTVQAISTKPTRVAFLVDDTDKNFVLQIGEISGDKQRIELSLSAK